MSEQHNNGVCPNCGYCPHCGRGGYQTIPYLPYPWYPTYPVYPIGPVWSSNGTSLPISDTLTTSGINSSPLMAHYSWQRVEA